MMPSDERTIWIKMLFALFMQCKQKSVENTCGILFEADVYLSGFACLYTSYNRIVMIKLSYWIGSVYMLLVMNIH